MKSPNHLQGHARSPGMRYRQGEIPAVGRFGRTQGDPHSWSRTVLIVAMRQWSLEELQAFERELAHHPDARGWFASQLPLTSLLKVLACVRQELADRGHPVSDFPERAHKIADRPRSTSKRALQSKAYRAALCERAGLPPPRTKMGRPPGVPPAPIRPPAPDAPWLQQPNETKHEDEE